MKLALLLAALIACGACDAQTYIGGSVGYGSNTAPTDTRPLTHVAVERDRESAAGSLFMGHRSGWWGVEAGAFTLPRYRGKAYTWDYSAYKGHKDPTDPQTAQIEGTIRGTALYARGQVYAPAVGGFTPYAFAGVAVSWNKSYEHGYYNHTQHVENDQRFRTVAPIFGVGVQYQMCDRWSARAELMRATGIVKNPHTGARDVDMVSLGLMYRWGGAK